MKRIAPVLLVILVLAGCVESRPAFDAANPLDAKVSGEKALAHVAALVEIGPRPAGSEAIEKSRQYLEKELAALGWTTRRDPLQSKTPQGTVEFVNVIARFGKEPWKRRVDGLLCSHYDTKRFDGFEFVGANDGGSSTGLLLELARVLATRPEVAEQIELVFFDGEEAFGTNITAKDGLYGSKHYAKQWLLKKEADRPRWGVLLDMVGDADLNVRAAVNIPGTSIRELAEARDEKGIGVDIVAVQERVRGISTQLLSAADEVEKREFIGVSPDYIIDDHIPLNVVAGIPTIDIIDFDYPAWHTPADTMDKLSAESLDTVGRVTLRLVEKFLIPAP